jgi:hypothetical protein
VELDRLPELGVGAEMGEDDLLARASSQKRPEPHARERAVVHHDQGNPHGMRCLQAVRFQVEEVGEHPEHGDPTAREGQVAKVGGRLVAECRDQLRSEALAGPLRMAVRDIAEPRDHVLELPGQRAQPDVLV